VITWYIEPFCSNLEEFVKKYGDDGKNELNTLCSKHQLEFGPQDDKTNFSYCGMHIRDGVLRLVFQENSFASNVSDASQDFHGALVAASKTGGGNALNIVARQSVREGYDPEIGAVQKAIAELVNVPHIELEPNFETNAAVLNAAGDKARSDWDKIIGQATLSYFEGLKDQLVQAGFKDDDMLQEGFQEGVNKSVISFRVVENLESGYHSTCVEDGVLVIKVCRPCALSIIRLT
jgi:hypothetical protein